MEWFFKLAVDAGALLLSYWARGFWAISRFISPLAEGVDRLLVKRAGAEEIIREDGGAPGPPAAIVRPVAPKKDEIAPSPSLSMQSQALGPEAQNPRDTALAHIKRYNEFVEFNRGGEARVRIAPRMIAQLYRSGRTATHELEDMILQKGLMKCHAAQEMPTLGLILDRLVLQDSGLEIVNMSAVEVICRKIHGLIRAFDDVKCEDDWKAPRNHPGQWRSKVRWGLYRDYDVHSLESDEWSITEAEEDEVTERFPKEAVFPRPLEEAQDSALRGAPGHEE